MEPQIKKGALEKKDIGFFLDLTFFAAALKASLWLISGFPALIRWISSLQILNN
jgi:hypothetical protein